MAFRPAEGYAKNIQVSEWSATAADGTRTVGDPFDVGDAANKAVRVNDVTPADFKGRGGDVLAITGDENDGMHTHDLQLRSWAEINAYWLRALVILTLYQTSGGLGTGQTAPEFLSAMGMELNPFCYMGQDYHTSPMGDR